LFVGKSTKLLSPELHFLTVLGWGFAPDPTGSLQCSPRPLAVFRGPTTKGKGEEERGGEFGRERGSSSFAVERKRKVGTYVDTC